MAETGLRESPEDGAVKGTRGRVTDKAWKGVRARLTCDVGTERIPVTGEREGADFEDGRHCYQVKLGRRLPAYLAQWLDGITATGRRKGKIGLVVWKPKGGKDEDAIVLMRWRDFVGEVAERATLIEARRRGGPPG